MSVNNVQFSNLEKILEKDPDLYTSARKIKEKAEDLLSHIPSMFPEYTPHTIRAQRDSLEKL